ncbi:T9SS type A sorting domain-containing protein [Lacibacter sediminis]|uniref:T9SS type A sorting domain-containing protein n=1 Tax=Lacibacter sediminis TaxID=2760713 RepID=A0A7G5XJY5_9BACT|nr:T9SS type A sorting domain-containing protein [Lacibacter sediminis]QNA45788.1 T9SS type A sorting domain-containing protein [Lacibacter sediminis]
MKKFLLSSALIMLVMGAFAQTTTCPTDAKRNNGNGNSRCDPYGGVGGTLIVSFPSAPNANLQLYQIINSQTGTTSTIIEASKIGALKPNGVYEIEWCFETDNAGALTQGGIQYQFYIDVAPFGEWNGEQLTLCTQSTLPVTLANFNAVQRSSKVSLTWETLFELNNDGFEIERRIGSGAYQKIAFVDSKAPGGNGDAFTYSFEDATSLPKGVTYYRLRQVDFDGRATYSEIKAVRTGNGAIVLSVYPNPSRGTTNVALPSGVGTYDVSLDDFTGKSVQRFSGLTTSNLQLNNLKPGMYMLRVSIRATGETITERIAVQ